MSEANDRIEVRHVGLPRTDTAHRPFIVASLGLATLVGFVLAIHVTITRLVDVGSPERTLDLIHGHGQVQLLGFAGLFVMGMSLRLMPRFAGGRLAFEPLIPVTLGFMTAGLVMRAVLMPWFSGDAHSGLLLASVFAILLGSSCFLFITVGTLAVNVRRFDASSRAFLFGASLLFVASAVTALVAVDATDRGLHSMPYLANNAILQLQLAGFLLSFILGVALRAIPALVGVERPGRSAGALAILLAGTVIVLASSFLYLEYASYSRAITLVADAAFLTLGLVLLALVWLAGILRQAANRLRPASRPHLWLVRSAFFWMVVAALTHVYAGGSSLIDGGLIDQFQSDAARHALGAGVITVLITGMSMMILPEFAAERQAPNQQHRLAFLLLVLLNAAALLRVAPPLAGSAWTFDQRNLSMAIAGSLAEVALFVFALYFLRLLFRSARS